MWNFTRSVHPFRKIIVAKKVNQYFMKFKAKDGSLADFQEFFGGS
jgi:hypothetical protein